MPPSNPLAALEALLFSSDQPLPLSLLAESLDLAPDQVAELLRDLETAYNARGAGVELREIAGGWLLVTAPEHAEWVGRLLRGKKKMRLSRAALESMAIVAYKQPVTKSEIEAIRGVDSSAVLATLLERNLVTIRGRSKVVGRPLLYGTTQEFLDYFGLRDLSELPRPEELRALVAAREPEQLDMMEVEAPVDTAAALESVTMAELEVVAQVGSDLPVSSDQPHEVEPLDGDVDDAVAEELGDPTGSAAD
jgi:segregation and condensation protein B